MRYKLKFLPSALKEWKKLAPPIQQQLRKKLRERLQQPHVEADRLRGFSHTYKIKLRAAGYRLAYEANDDEVIVYVITIGRRERNLVYQKAKQRKR